MSGEQPVAFSSLGLNSAKQANQGFASALALSLSLILPFIKSAIELGWLSSLFEYFWSARNE